MLFLNGPQQGALGLANGALVLVPDRKLYAELHVGGDVEGGRGEVLLHGRAKIDIRNRRNLGRVEIVARLAQGAARRLDVGVLAQDAGQRFLRIEGGRGHVRETGDVGKRQIVQAE